MEEDEVELYGKYVECLRCHGTGRIVYHDILFGEVPGECPDCHGTGKILEVYVDDVHTPVRVVRVGWGY